MCDDANIWLSDLEAKMRFPEPMDELIQVRVASDEKRRLIEVARRRGLTLSDFLRHTATEAAQRVAA